MQNVERLTVTVPEMAKMVGISKCTAYNMIHRADFPVIWVGRRAVIPVDGLKRWLDNQAGYSGYSERMELSQRLKADQTGQNGATV